MARLPNREDPRQPANGATQNVAGLQQTKPGALLWQLSQEFSFSLCIKVTRESGIGWIAIKMSDRSGKNLAAKAEWDSLEGEMTMEIVNSIAAKHGVTGKLILYEEPFISALLLNIRVPQGASGCITSPRTGWTRCGPSLPWRCSAGALDRLSTWSRSVILILLVTKT